MPTDRWYRARLSLLLFAIGFYGLCFLESYHWLVASTSKATGGEYGFRRYLLELLVRDSGPVATLYGVGHFCMVALMVIGLAWLLAASIARIILRDLDPDGAFRESVLKNLIEPIRHGSALTTTALSISVLAGPVIASGVLGGALLSVSTSVDAFVEERRQETKRWEEVRTSLERLELLWTIQRTPGSLPPSTVANRDRQPVFARYPGVVREAWPQGQRINIGDPIIRQDCEAADREAHQTEAEITRARTRLANLPSSAPEFAEFNVAQRRFERFRKLRDQGTVSDDEVDELEAEAHAAHERAVTSQQELANTRIDAETTITNLEKWAGLLGELRAGCVVASPANGLVEMIVTTGTFLPGAPGQPVAWIRMDEPAQ